MTRRDAELKVLEAARKCLSDPWKSSWLDLEKEIAALDALPADDACPKVGRREQIAMTICAATAPSFCVCKRDSRSPGSMATASKCIEALKAADAVLALPADDGWRRAETPAEEIARLQREIGERQSRLQFLVLGDQRKSFHVPIGPASPPDDGGHT